MSSEIIEREDGSLVLPSSADPAVAMYQAVGFRRFSVGLDVGRYTDPSALCIIKAESKPYFTGRGFEQKLTQPQYSIVYTETVKNLDYTDLVDMVVARLRKLKHWNLLCDASGMGGPVVSLFHQASVRCTGVTITAGSTITRDGSKVTCSKNLLLENLATQIENGSCVIAHDLPGRDQLLQEIAAFELTFTSAGNPVLQGGGKGHHSDTAIAAALALLGETHLAPRQMEVRKLQGFF